MTRPRLAVATNFVGYGASLTLLTLASLTQVLVLTSVLGLAVWADLAVAQAAGLLAAAVTSLGLIAFGPSLVAPMAAADAARFFLRTQVARGYLFLVTSCVVVVAAYVLAEHEPAAAAGTALAMNTLALGGSWYFIGQRLVRPFVLRDTLPQVAGMIGGLPVAAALGATAYSVVLLAASLLVALLAFRAARARAGNYAIELGPRVALTVGRMQAVPLASVCTGAVNSYGPLLLASHFVGGASAYAVMDRLVKYGLAAFGPVLQVLQGWVPAEPGRLRARAHRALLIATLAGVVAGSIAYLLTPAVGRLLGVRNQEVLLQLRLPMAIGLGLLLVGLVTSQVLLVPLGRQVTILRSTTAGAVLLLVAGPALALTRGESGVAWASVCGELVAITWQVFEVLARTRRPDPTGEPAVRVAR